MNSSCLYCEEPVLSTEDHLMMPVIMDMETVEQRLIHSECLMRQSAGSVGHQLGKCPCFGGTDEDPVGLTKREAARKAARLFFELHHAPTGRA